MVYLRDEVDFVSPLIVEETMVDELVTRAEVLLETGDGFTKVEVTGDEIVDEAAVFTPFSLELEKSEIIDPADPGGNLKLRAIVLRTVR